MSATGERLARIYGGRLRRLASTVPEGDIVLTYLERHAPTRGRLRLLDAGCGNGRYARTLAMKGYGEVHGVDLVWPAAGRDFFFVRGDLSRLPYPAESFDFVYSNSVLYHLERPAIAIRELARVTKAGGTFLMTAHTPRSLFTLYRRARMTLSEKAFENLRGAQFPSAGEYAAWLKACGFRVLQIDGYRLVGLHQAAEAARRSLLRRLPRATILDRPWWRGVTRYRWLARLKSVMGYHMILVAQKEDRAS